MTRQQLREKQAAASKRAGWLLLIPLGIAGMAMAAHGYLNPEIERLSPRIQGIIFVGALMGFVTTMPIALWLITRKQRKLGLMCPHCQKPMMGTEGMFVMTTGRCGHCGHKILTEDD